MSDLKRFSKLVDDIWELVFGSVRRPEVKFKGMVKHAIPKKIEGYTNKKPKRARGPKGRYKGDDKSTPHINEAWVGGKAPKRGKK